LTSNINIRTNTKPDNSELEADNDFNDTNSYISTSNDDIFTVSSLFVGSPSQMRLSLTAAASVPKVQLVRALDSLNCLRCIRGYRFSDKR